MTERLLTETDHAPNRAPATGDTLYTLLIHYSEIGLKGRNQPRFRRQLRDNLRHTLKTLGLNWPVEESQGALGVTVPPRPERPVEAVARELRQVPGVAWVACARRVPHRGFTSRSQAEDLEQLQRHLLALARERFAPGQTFCVRVRRGVKSLPFTSPELEGRFGGFLREHTSWDRVKLPHPDVTFHIDIRKQASFVFSQKLKGPGGLPVGSAGRVLVLLSGGIDSPVAAYLMAKRGCAMDFLHFTATAPAAVEAQHDKVARLARQLSRYTLAARLFLVPYVYFDVALFGQQADYDLILFRRFMVRVAEQLAGRLKVQALVSGDNLCQVASQTLSNLAATDRAATLPLLRPLLGYNKDEIMELARQIGTYEPSIEPYKDCCALISRSPRTSSQHERLNKLEQRLFPNYQSLIDQTLADAVCLEIRPADR